MSLGNTDDNSKKKGLFQRFKDAYKQYGTALIAVHVATSCVWFTTFYSAAHYGLDITPILEKFLEPETIEKAQNSPLGHAALAYLMYKLATPARYAVTIGGTQLTVQQLKKMGVWKEIDEKEKIGSLLREGKDNVKDKIREGKDNVKDKIREGKDNVKDKFREGKDNVKDKMNIQIKKAREKINK